MQRGRVVRGRGVVLVGAVAALLLAAPAVPPASVPTDGAPAATAGVGDPAPAPVARAVAVRTTAAAGCATAASADWPITRIAGADRFATAACVATVGHPDGAATVVLARGDDAGGFADALAGTVLADAVEGPVLLTGRDRLPAVTATAIRDLGASRVVVLGGTAAVSRSVVAEVRALGPRVERLRGDDRAGTAAAIAAEVPGDAAFVVNGFRPADALTAGAAAARSGAALLLTGRDEVPDVTRSALAGRSTVTVVGGAAVVGARAEAQLRRAGGEVRRLGGATRYETAATVARVHDGDGTIHLVSGADANLVDAIPAGWLAAMPGGGPVVYTRPDAPDRGTDRYLRLGPLAGGPETRVVGGARSVTDGMLSILEQRYAEAARGGPAAQLRGMWVHLFDDSLKTRDGIEQVLNTAAAANLNTVVVQGARRHDAFYDSDVLPRTTDPDLEPGLDVLGTLIPAAHARGLEVHVWWSMMPSTHPSMQDEDLGPDHVNTRHGVDGTGTSWVTAGWTPGYEFLDPAVPGVQDHVASMVREVVERYDVDGVHLDYLRYECLRANDNGTCVYSDADNPAATENQNPITMRRWREVGAGRPLADFLRDQATDLVRRITLEVADADPSVVVSAALISQGQGPTGGDLRASFRGTRAYVDKGQDWGRWVDEDLLDHVYPMDYFDQDRYPAWFEQWASFAEALDEPDHVTALGQASYLNCVDDSVAQVRRSTTALDGAVLYSYQGDVDGACGQPRGELARRLTAADGPFASPAPVPAVPRRDAPTTGWVLVDDAGDGARVTLTGVGEGTAAPAEVRRADATGHAGFVDVAPGTWQVRVDGGAAEVVEVTTGEVTRVTD